jgi:hypothetical protein
MVLRRVVGGVALVTLAALALGAERRAATISSAKCYEAFAEHRLGGHEWRSHPDILRLREVRGTITNEVGGWPEGSRVIFQTLGPATHPVVRTAVAAPDGAFRIPGMPAGEYCFEASAIGWDPVGGRLVVSSKSPKDATITLSLPLAQ